MRSAPSDSVSNKGTRVTRGRHVISPDARFAIQDDAAARGVSTWHRRAAGELDVQAVVKFPGQPVGYCASAQRAQPAPARFPVRTKKELRVADELRAAALKMRSKDMYHSDYGDGREQQKPPCRLSQPRAHSRFQPERADFFGARRRCRQCVLRPSNSIVRRPKRKLSAGSFAHRVIHRGWGLQHPRL